MASLTPDEWSAIGLSLRVGVVATIVAIPFALVIALRLARGRFPGRLVLDAIVHLPLVAPPVVTGYLLLLAFGRNGPVGRFLEETFGIVLAFRWTGAVLAAAVMGLPLMVRSMRLSVEAIDRKLEDAARTLGAGRVRVFLRITLPLMMPGILAGAVLCFARALGEFGATITFVGNIPGETRTIPTAIYTELQVPGGDPAALRLTVISLAIALGALLVAEILARKARGKRRRVIE
ncbi:MAG: molybdate ABC transporter permease subunit [Bauldia sp.]